MDDRELVERLRKDDQDAFDIIFRSFHPQLVGFAESMLRDSAAAEDVVQDVMLELWRRRQTLAGTEEQSLRSYLFQATRNRSLNHLRHLKVEQKSEPELMGEEAIPAVGASTLIEGEIGDALRAAVAELPPRCREVFELSRVRELRYAEIAVTLGISIKTVETQMGKALKLIRTRLAPWLENRGQ